MKNEGSLQEEVEAAEAIRQQMFTDAGALFLAGSIIRGEGNEHSDLDIVVIYEHLSPLTEVPLDSLAGPSKSLSTIHPP